jgi:hypothetical protein
MTNIYWSNSPLAHTIRTSDGYMVEHLVCDLDKALRELALWNEHDPDTGYVLDTETIMADDDPRGA